MEVDPKNREKPVLRGQGLWQSKVMVVCFSNASSAFEKLMERARYGLLLWTSLLYLDDILLNGKTFELKLIHLQIVWDKLKAANLRLNAKKLKWFQKEINCHIMSWGNAHWQKTEAMQSQPTYPGLADVQNFVGLCSYYSKFVCRFANIAKSLQRLSEKRKSFQWSAESELAFSELTKAQRDWSCPRLSLLQNSTHIGQGC